MDKEYMINEMFKVLDAKNRIEETVKFVISRAYKLADRDGDEEVRNMSDKEISEYTETIIQNWQIRLNELLTFEAAEAAYIFVTENPQAEFLATVFPQFIRFAEEGYYALHQGITSAIDMNQTSADPRMRLLNMVKDLLGNGVLVEGPSGGEFNLQDALSNFLKMECDCPKCREKREAEALMSGIDTKNIN